MSGERIDVAPEPTSAEAEAIRRALEALGLLEADRADGGPGVRPRLSVRDGSVTLSTQQPTP